MSITNGMTTKLLEITSKKTMMVREEKNEMKKMEIEMKNKRMQIKIRKILGTCDLLGAYVNGSNWC